jgi:hypothetical protein
MVKEYSFPMNRKRGMFKIFHGGDRNDRGTQTKNRTLQNEEGGDPFPTSQRARRIHSARPVEKRR